MSLRVKLPFTDRLRLRQKSSSDPAPGGGSSSSNSNNKARGLQTCTSCGFSSRHRVLFDRHAKRCQNGLRPPQVVARNYKCKQCKFSTTGSKEYLQHLKEKHREDFSIFLCDLCEYASRQKCKVLRHRKIIHRTAKPVDPESLNQGEESAMEQEGVVVLNGVEGGDGQMQAIEDNRIDGIHEMEQESDDDIQEVNGEEVVDDGALSGAESDPQSMKSSVTSIASPIKSTDNAMHYIQRIANSPESKQPAYQCALCTYSNVQKWKVANHVRAFHMKKNVFKCPVCPYVTTRKIEFCIHKTKHSDKKVWECQECEYKSESQTSFDRHLENHTANLPYKCALCSYSSTGESEVQQHIKECHPSDDLAVNNASVSEELPPLEPHVIEPQIYIPVEEEESSQDISCRVCGLKVKNDSKLRIHMVSHSTESVHWCPLCTLKYKRSSDLNRHMKRKHGKRLRDFFFMGQQEQPLNLTVTKEEMEAEAAANFNAPIVIDDLQQATSSTDEQPLDLSVPKSANLPLENLKCSHCSYQAKWPSDLRRHLLVHSVEKRFKCPCCHRKYKYQFDLNMHLRRMHRMPAGRTKVFASAATGPPVVNIANLDSSSVTLPEGMMNAPQGDDDIIYEETPNPDSPKQFLKVNRYKLTRQQVSPQGKYKCDYCPYLGKYQSEVDRHMRLHTGEKPYSCVFCVYRSHWRGDMKRHLQKHHSGEDGVVDDITNLMEQTYQPDAPPDGAEALEEQEGAEGDMEDGDVKSDMMDVDREEDDDGPSELVIDVNPRMTAGDPGSDQDGMEFMTLTPTSSSSGSAIASPNKANGDKRQNMCPYCPFTCEAPSKLKCHMEIHENLKRFKCAHCGKRSNWTWDVRKHIKKEHPNKELNVIELKEEEARETLPDYLQSHYKVLPKKEMMEKMERNDLPTQVPLHRFTDQLPPIDTMGVLAPLHPSNLSDGSYMEDEDGVSDYSEPRTYVQTAMRHPSIATKRCRPFKCSKCGRRSNWKWDMNKHIRNVHPQAKLIVLTPDEARATMPKGGFKNTNTGRKENTNVKMNIIVKQETPSPPKQKHNHQFDSNRTKKFKCSACPYRSDYRSDIGRHLKRLHSPGSAIIQMLSDEEARSTLQEYKDRWVRGKFVFSPAKEKLYQEVDQQNTVAKKTLSNMFDLQPVQNAVEFEPPPVVVRQTAETVKSESTVLVPPCTEKTKKWKCPKCSYQDPNKKMVMRHMRQHPKVKVFQCRMCGEASDYRNSMYRHVRNRHNSTDYSGIVHESIAYVTTVVKSELEADMDGDEDTPVTYRCKICGQTSSWKSGIMRHVAETHNKEKVNSFVEVIQVSNILPALPQQVTNSGEVYFMSPDDAKQLRCDVCPYRTNKSGLLKIHKTYHNPQPGNKFKCKYCPYYVSAMRLLHQHVRLHLQELPVENNNNNDLSIKGELDEEEEMEMDLSPNAACNDESTDPVKVSAGMSPGSAQSSPGRRYYCDQCPAVSRNKNDFLYHKQFHRPKPSAPFKCKLCNYWVSQRRLLRQHERVHLSEYIEHYHNNSLNSPKPEVLKTYADKGGSIPQMVLASPAKSDISDYDDAVQMANIKQQLIASKITTVPITPQKYSEGAVRSSPLTMPGYMVDTNGQYLNSGTFHQLNKCSHCPFTSLRASLLHRHEQMHGSKPNEDYLRCPYCTFNVPNKKILHKHITVHSTSYQPGIDNINDVDVDVVPEEADNKEESTENGEKKQETEEVSVQSVNPPSTPANSEQGRGIKRSADGALLNMSCLPKNSEFYVKFDRSTGGHQLERGSFKKWCCEKCPYATMKRAQFERHITLHASGQKYVCEFCDYSVPAYHLLLQHKKLHMHPNPNLLTAQSISNLQKLPEVPADIAAAANFPATTTDPASQYGTQDTANLFENSSDFSEPKKLYRCDRCPYTNVRRDHLLSHLRFHMVQSEFKCPYCDYSVSKQHLLVQHIKVHFNAPGCEGFTAPNSALNLSVGRPASAPAASTDISKAGEKNDVSAKGDVDETTSQPEYIDLAELSKAGLLKPVRCKDPLPEANSGEVVSAEKKNGESVEKEAEKKDGDQKEKSDAEKKEAKAEGKWICQYCDRTFKASEELLKHETQHLVGNQF